MHSESEPHEYMGSTRMKMAEYTKQARERYYRENSVSVENVKIRNQSIENQDNSKK